MAEDPTAILVTLGNVGLAMAVGLFVNAIARQSEQRRLAIEALERARAELAETAAENDRLLATAHQAGVLDERRRLAREMHDTVAQGLTGIVMQLEAAEALAAGGGVPPELAGHLDSARRMARESLGEARRAVHALRPAALEASRLPDALAELADRFTAETGVKATATATGETRPLAAPVEVALLRVAQEALANVRKHAAARHVEVQITAEPDRVETVVADDGRGFDPGRARGGDDRLPISACPRCASARSLSAARSRSSAPRARARASSSASRPSPRARCSAQPPNATTPTILWTAGVEER
jgi:signal transduction histidine kinase